jgi:hypothetical protein
MLMSMHQ